MDKIWFLGKKKNPDYPLKVIGTNKFEGVTQYNYVTPKGYLKIEF